MHIIIHSHCNKHNCTVSQNSLFAVCGSRDRMQDPSLINQSGLLLKPNTYCFMMRLCAPRILKQNYLNMSPTRAALKQRTESAFVRQCDPIWFVIPGFWCQNIWIRIRLLNFKRLKFQRPLIKLQMGNHYPEIEVELDIGIRSLCWEKICDCVKKSTIYSHVTIVMLT